MVDNINQNRDRTRRMMPLSICVKKPNYPREISEKVEKFFDFLRIEDTTIGEKSKSFLEDKNRRPSMGVQ